MTGIDIRVALFCLIIILGMIAVHALVLDVRLERAEKILQKLLDTHENRGRMGLE